MHGPMYIKKRLDRLYILFIMRSFIEFGQLLWALFLLEYQTDKSEGSEMLLTKRN